MKLDDLKRSDWLHTWIVSHLPDTDLIRPKALEIILHVAFIVGVWPESEQAAIHRLWKASVHLTTDLDFKLIAVHHERVSAICESLELPWWHGDCLVLSDHLKVQDSCVREKPLFFLVSPNEHEVVLTHVVLICLTVADPQPVVNEAEIQPKQNCYCSLTNWLDLHYWNIHPNSDCLLGDVPGERFILSAFTHISLVDSFNCVVGSTEFTTNWSCISFLLLSKTNYSSHKQIRTWQVPEEIRNCPGCPRWVGASLSSYTFLASSDTLPVTRSLSQCSSNNGLTSWHWRSLKPG